jgi:hypothetical protein
MAVVDSDQPDVIINRLEPIAGIGSWYDQQVVITSYATLWQMLRVATMMYPSFDTGLRPKRLNDAFPPVALERLRILRMPSGTISIFRLWGMVNPSHNGFNC